LYIGRVLGLDVHDAPPLLYHGSRYHGLGPAL
jgi:hypothetical protein